MVDSGGQCETAQNGGSLRRGSVNVICKIKSKGIIKNSFKVSFKISEATD